VFSGYARSSVTGHAVIEDVEGWDRTSGASHMSPDVPAADTQEQRAMSVDEAAEMYRDQWILMRVTERDDEGSLSPASS
jgi:hypothetical protein